MMNNNDIVEIVPHLFVSNWDTSNNIDVIKRYDIRAVLTVETRSKPRDIVYYYLSHNINFKHINLQDIPNANISIYFDSSYDFINYHISRGENVLVHCWAGVSRSVTLILNYILKKYYLKYRSQGIPPENAVQNLILSIRQQSRPIINPNSGFLDQLIMKCLKYRRGFFVG